MALIYGGYYSSIQGENGYSVALHFAVGENGKSKIPLFSRDFNIPLPKDCRRKV
jgi:hypothetical protein